MSAKPTSVDAYLAGLPEERRRPMEELRATIRAAAPDATEVITYNMPGYRLAGRFLVSFDAYRHHYSLFPASDRVLREHPGAAPYTAGKGTLRFPSHEPIPTDLVAGIVRTRVAEVAEENARRR